MKKFIKTATLIATTWTLAEMVTQYRLDSGGLSFPKYTAMYFKKTSSDSVAVMKRNYKLASNGDVHGAYLAMLDDFKPLK